MKESIIEKSRRESRKLVLKKEKKRRKNKEMSTGEGKACGKRIDINPAILQ